MQAQRLIEISTAAKGERRESPTRLRNRVRGSSDYRVRFIRQRRSQPRERVSEIVPVRLCLCRGLALSQKTGNTTSQQNNRDNEWKPSHLSAIKDARGRKMPVSGLSDDEYQLVRTLDEQIGAYPDTLKNVIKNSEDKALVGEAREALREFRKTSWEYRSEYKTDNDGYDVMADSVWGGESRNKITFYKKMVDLLPGKNFKSIPMHHKGYHEPLVSGIKSIRHVIGHEARHATRSNYQRKERFPRMSETQADRFGQNISDYWR